MWIAVLFSAMAGVFGVLQAGMNKDIAQVWGFPASLLFNGCLFLVFNFLFFSLVYFFPKYFPQSFIYEGNWSQIKWWWLVPGLLGFSLVMGLAVSIGKIGAIQTFVISIVAQVVASFAWDVFCEGKELSFIRILGAAIALGGAVIATYF